jgi:hypothetical protein
MPVRTAVSPRDLHGVHVIPSQFSTDLHQPIARGKVYNSQSPQMKTLQLSFSVPRAPRTHALRQKLPVGIPDRQSSTGKYALPGSEKLEL